MCGIRLFFAGTKLVSAGFKTHSRHLHHCAMRTAEHRTISIIKRPNQASKDLSTPLLTVTRRCHPVATLKLSTIAKSTRPQNMGFPMLEQRTSGQLSDSACGRHSPGACAFSHGTTMKAPCFTDSPCKASHAVPIRECTRKKHTGMVWTQSNDPDIYAERWPNIIPT